MAAQLSRRKFGSVRTMGRADDGRVYLQWPMSTIVDYLIYDGQNCSYL
jgi:hypothetical protein